MKPASSLLLAACVAAAASTTVVQVLLPMLDEAEIVGSVISAGPTATEYFVACPTNEPEEDCGAGDGMRVVYGQSTWSYAMTYQAAAFTALAECKLDPAENSADCRETIIRPGHTSAGADTLTSYSDFVVPLTITAGAEKLSGAATAATTATEGPSATGGPSTADGSGTAATTPTTLSTAAVPPTTSAANNNGTAPAPSTVPAPSSSSSTAGVPRITQNAAVLGAAAMIGGAILL